MAETRDWASGLHSIGEGTADQAMTEYGYATPASIESAIQQAGAKGEAAAAPVTPERTTFIAVSKNLVDPSALTEDVLLGGPSRLPVPLAGYTVTGFIPVTAGLAYTLSNPRNVALYDQSKVWVGSSGWVDNTGQGPVTITPEVDGYLRASFTTATYLSTFQVEKGSTATAYEPWSRTLTGVTVPPDTTPIDPERTTFIAVSKNLYNPDDPDVTPGHTLGGPSRTPVPLTSYTVTGFIPVTAGQAYTLSNPRSVALYTTEKVWVGTAGWIDNTGQGPVTITPTVNGYLRASYTTAAYDATFQVEEGTTATAYKPYGLTIPGLNVELPSAGAIKVTRSGAKLTITTALDDASLTQTASLTGSSNGTFSWLTTIVDGVTRHSPSDSITPLRTTMGTVGANHGFSQVRDFANPDGKTAADLGSTWTDGSKTYTLLQITPAGRLVLGGPATTSGGVTSTVNVAPAADLTHVAGATKTATIVASTIGAAMQLYPSISKVSVTATLDGAPLSEGESTGAVLRISESYEILDYADLLSKMQANVGTPYAALPIEGAVRMSVLYEMCAPGTWLISTTVTALKPTTLGQCGFIQSEAMSVPSGGALWRWVPGVKPKSGHDFHAGVNITSYATSLLVTSADLLDTTKPPTWMLEWARDSAGEDVLGFAHGYTPDKTEGSWVARVASAPSNFWDLRSTKKSYPTAFTSRSLAPGERVSVQAWRAYLPPSRPNGLTVTDAQAAYGFALAAGASSLPVPLPEQVGRAIAPLLEQGLTIAPGIVDADGLTVTGTGHAIARLT